MKNSEPIEPPFRIMPSRSREIRAPLALISIGVVLFAGGLWKQDDAAGGSMLILAVILIASSSFWFLRERRYFDPRNEYWIEIGIDEFALVTPDATARSAWGSLSPFEVRETRTRHKTKYGTRESVTYDVVAEYGNLTVKIPLGDFATALGNDELGRAQAMSSILNELRQNVLNRQAGAGPTLSSSGRPYGRADAACQAQTLDRVYFGSAAAVDTTRAQTAPHAPAAGGA